MPQTLRRKDCLKDHCDFDDLTNECRECLVRKKLRIEGSFVLRVEGISGGSGVVGHVTDIWTIYILTTIRTVPRVVIYPDVPSEVTLLVVSHQTCFVKFSYLLLPN